MDTSNYRPPWHLGRRRIAVKRLVFSLLLVATPAWGQWSGILGASRASGGGGASFTDTFARSNENPLSDAGAWTSVTGNGFTGLKLVSNRAIGITASANNASIVTTPTFTAQHRATITRNAFDDSSIGPICRFDTNGNGYRLNLESSGAQVTVYKVTAGSPSALGASFSVTTGAGDTIGMSVSGTSTVTLTVYINGVSQGTRTDSSSPFTTGSPGAFSNGNNTFDAFTAVDF